MRIVRSCLYISPLLGKTYTAALLHLANRSSRITQVRLAEEKPHTEITSTKMAIWLFSILKSIWCAKWGTNTNSKSINSLLSLNQPVQAARSTKTFKSFVPNPPWNMAKVNKILSRFLNQWGMLVNPTEKQSSPCGSSQRCMCPYPCLQQRTGFGQVGTTAHSSFLNVSPKTLTW